MTAITLNRFWGGCRGAFHWNGVILDAQSGGDVESTSQSVGVSFSQADSFHGREGCGAVCGLNLTMGRKLTPGWCCKKDFIRVYCGIELIELTTIDDL
jgi:hypothetical protein